MLQCREYWPEGDTMSFSLKVVGIAVKNMGESLKFYRSLGLEIPEGQDAEGHVQVEFDGITIAWDTVEVLKGVYGEWEEHPVGHRIELAFQCGSGEQVDAVYRRITAAGQFGHREPWDAFWGQRYAIVTDPDGNLISLFA